MVPSRLKNTRKASKASLAMLLEEVPVAVDSFNHDGGVLFFCSHAHEDHLKGLNKKWRKGPLFASAITRQLLLLKWPSLEITALELGRTYQIPLMDGLEIEVYLIDANHVPGSVMFLFSGYFGSVLYTGDFRLHEKHQDIASLAPVRDLVGPFLQVNFGSFSKTGPRVLGPRVV